MYAQRLKITLPDEIAQELKRTIPKGKRSKYIAEAIREELIKRGYISQ